MKHPNLVRKKPTSLLNPKYNIIEKNIHVKKIVNKKNESKLKLEKELMESRRPNVFTYAYSDKKIKEKKPDYTFTKADRERAPSPDMRKALNVKLEFVKKRSKSIKILPEHKYTNSEIERELEKKKLGPATYEVEFTLTERRPDLGIVKIKLPYNPIKEEDNEDDRPELYPNYDIDKPNRLTFKYHEPVKDVGP
jgi:hypothetical protein